MFTGGWELGGYCKLGGTRKEHSISRNQRVRLAGAGSGTDRRCPLFLRYSFPSDSTMYDRDCVAG